MRLGFARYSMCFTCGVPSAWGRWKNWFHYGIKRRACQIQSNDGGKTMLLCCDRCIERQIAFPVQACVYAEVQYLKIYLDTAGKSD